MRRFLVTVMFAALPLAAQQCPGPAPAGTIRTIDPYVANFFLGGPCWPPCTLPPTYTGAGLLCDLFADAPIAITGLEIQLYDEGTPAANPDQTGNRGEARIYTCATTWLGNETTPPGAPGSPWTLAATGIYTVARFPAASPIALAAPLALPAGPSGLLLELAPTNTVFHPPNQNVGAVHPLLHSGPAAARSDQFVRLSLQSAQTLAFQSFPTPNLGFNAGIDYQPDPNAAWSQPMGPGCYDSPFAFHEAFAGNFDLAGASQRWTFTGRNYELAPGTSSFVPPVGTPLTAIPPTAPPGETSWNDALSAPITLPAPFPFPGGPAGGTTTITIASNGRVLLRSSSNPFAAWPYTAAPAAFVEPPAIAPCFGDFDPSAGGALHYETDNASWARVTWLDVPEWTGTVANRFQVTLHVPSGNVDIVYGPMASGLHPMRFGFTPGGNVPSAAIDVSAALPWSSGLGIAPPRLRAVARPQLGSTLQLTTDGLVPGTATVLTALGLTGLPGGLALGAFGMQDCTLFVGSFDLLWVLGAGSGTATASLPLPSASLGLPLFAQSAGLTSGYNAAGLLLSNGLCLQLR